jgi:hypothetical protein
VRVLEKRFAAAIEEIRKRSDCIVQVTTGGAVGMSIDERADCLRCGPEMATLNCGTLNFGDDVFVNTRPDIRRLAEKIQAAGAVAELECYEVGHVEEALRLHAAGAVAEQIKRAQQRQALMGQAPAGWAAGAECLAYYATDGQWYPAKVESVTEGGNFVVVYEGYGNSEEVRGGARLGVRVHASSLGWWTPDDIPWPDHTPSRGCNGAGAAPQGCAAREWSAPTAPDLPALTTHLLPHFNHRRRGAAFPPNPRVSWCPAPCGPAPTRAQRRRFTGAWPRPSGSAWRRSPRSRRYPRWEGGGRGGGLHSTGVGKGGSVSRLPSRPRGRRGARSGWARCLGAACAAAAAAAAGGRRA